MKNPDSQEPDGSFPQNNLIGFWALSAEDVLLNPCVHGYSGSS
jgi:hypothetical protein